jgi:(S)-2-hydroxyglutarate dehydrogenase
VTVDYLVIGGGIMGLSIARELRRRHARATITLIEKEQRLGEHASGRNSGVLHAGFYYSADSLKAKFTRAGNAQLSEYCDRKGLAINRCGKLVVAQGAEDLPRLDELHRRGIANGVALEMIGAADARRIEPRVRTHERALWSPSTASVDPVAVMNALMADAVTEGIEVRSGTAYRSLQGRTVRTTTGAIEAGHVVNAAGLYADRIARDFGAGARYRILPFRGLYLHSSEKPGALRTNIYPVPDPRFPFLGVHFTVNVAGGIKIGPTAMPALWREQYSGLSNFSAAELAQTLTRGALLIGRDGALRRHAAKELMNWSRAGIVREASALATGVRVEDFQRWGRPGIRAQLVDTRGKLEMDFVVEGDARSTHVLNAVSPGFTCALPFAEYVVDRMEQR